MTGWSARQVPCRKVASHRPSGSGALGRGGHTGAEASQRWPGDRWQILVRKSERVSADPAWSEAWSARVRVYRRSVPLVEEAATSAPGPTPSAGQDATGSMSRGAP